MPPVRQPAPFSGNFCALFCALVFIDDAFLLTTHLVKACSAKIAPQRQARPSASFSPMACTIIRIDGEWQEL
jgi:hypothetical protein